MYHRGKIRNNIRDARGKLLISHNENNKHVCKQLHRSLNKNFLVFRKFLVFTFKFFKLRSLNSLVMAK